MDKELIVLYSLREIDDYGTSFLKAIKKNIDNAQCLDVDRMNKDKIKEITLSESPILLVEPFGNEFVSKFFKEILNIYPKRNIEYKDGQSLISESLIEFTSRRTMIINRSERLGIPLVNYINQHRKNILAINSDYRPEEIQALIRIFKPSTLISATNDEDFKLDLSESQMMTVIDLSDDIIGCEHKITNVGIIDVLKGRLKK